MFGIPEVESILREKSLMGLDKAQKAKIKSFLQTYAPFQTQQEQFFPNMYDQAYEIAKRVEKVFYPSEKLKILQEAYSHAQIS